MRSTKIIFWRFQILLLRGNITEYHLSTHSRRWLVEPTSCATHNDEGEKRKKPEIPLRFPWEADERRSALWLWALCVEIIFHFDLSSSDVFWTLMWSEGKIILKMRIREKVFPRLAAHSLHLTLSLAKSSRAAFTENPSKRSSHSSSAKLRFSWKNPFQLITH